MSLRLLLIIVGILLFLLIAWDAKRKSKIDDYADIDEDKLQKQRELEQELPYGSSRKLDDNDVRNFNDNSIFDDDPIPLLKQAMQEEDPVTRDFDSSHPNVRNEFIEPNLEIDTVDLENKIREPKLDLHEHDNTELLETQILEEPLQNNHLNLATQLNLQAQESAENVAEEEILFKAPITKGLVDIEKNIWANATDWIVMRVMADEGKEYNLAEFWDFCEQADLRYSERGFIHRFLEKEDSSHIQFSIINALEPGNLIVNKANSYTKGFVLVQPLPGGYMPETIVEDMYQVSKDIVDYFGGSILDDEHSAFTDQTLLYYKDKIRKFILRQKLPTTNNLQKIKKKGGR